PADQGVLRPPAGGRQAPQGGALRGGPQAAAPGLGGRAPPTRLRSAPSDPRPGRMSSPATTPEAAGCGGAQPPRPGRPPQAGAPCLDRAAGAPCYTAETTGRGQRGIITAPSAQQALAGVPAPSSPSRSVVAFTRPLRRPRCAQHFCLTPLTFDTG